uniref:Uncharacterized protein n=1 Tax=Solanum tuberosum TaxID=4113 RepID=M1AM49_SOLTU
MNNRGGRNGESIMMEEDLFLNGQISGQKLSLEQNGETSGKRNFSLELVHGKERLGMCHPSVIDGPGHGERSTSEMAKCTSTARAQQVKVGTSLWMKELTTRLNLTMDGQML